MKRFLLIIAFACAPSLMGAAGSPVQDQFNLANQFYEKGNLDKAFEIYTTLVSQGYESAALDYNLANVYYRKGERGKSILWYERAKRLTPRDADIQFNLSLARSHLKDQETNWLRSFVFYLTDNELAVLVSVLLWIFLGLFGAMTLGWVRLEIWPGLILWTTGLFIVLFGTWLGAHLVWGREHTAIVTSVPGEVRNGPGSDYAVGFTVPEGSEVIVLNRRPEWTQIGVIDQGLKGWIPSAQIELVKPPLPLH